MNKKLLSRITRAPKVMAGKPVIRGTRVPVDRILKMLSQDISVDEIQSKADDASSWLDTTVQDMARAIAAVEQNAPEVEHQAWLKSMETAVKPLEVDDA